MAVIVVRDKQKAISRGIRMEIFFIIMFFLASGKSGKRDDQKTRSPVGKKSRRGFFDFIAIQTPNGSMREKQRLLQHHIPGQTGLDLTFLYDYPHLCAHDKRVIQNRNTMRRKPLGITHRTSTHFSLFVFSIPL